MNKLENRLYKRLDLHIPNWDICKLESSTHFGIPDTNVLIKNLYNPIEFWLELKALSSPQIIIRASQYSWMSRRTFNGGNCWILNENPKTKEIKLWKFVRFMPVERASEKHVRILAPSNATFYHIKELREINPKFFLSTAYPMIKVS